MSERQSERLTEFGKAFREEIHDTTSQVDAESIVLALAPHDRSALEYIETVDKTDFVNRMKSIFKGER